jgi:hypothetical protein
MFVYHQTVGQNHNIKVANKSLKNVTNFKYLGAVTTNQNYIHEEIKIILNLGKACYYKFWNLSSQLSKKVKTKTFKIIISYNFVLYGCETWSLTLTL